MRLSEVAARWRLALIPVAAALAYWPALQGGFIWNDSDYVTRAELRSGEGLGRIWFELGATEQYYPVLHTAFWVEHGLWGDSALGYHAANVALHALSALLLVAILRRLCVPGAFLAGLLFAVHPVCVESVAWISEQKNTLSTAFYLAAALAYLRWRDQGGERRQSGLLWAGVLCVLALLSKSATATLPAALLVIAWWRNGKLSWREDVRPLVPWFAAAVAWGSFSAWVEHSYVGAQGRDFALGLGQRLLVAGRAAWFYACKLVWPSDLIFIYPRWSPDTADLAQWVYPAALAALFAGLVWTARRSRAPLAVALLYIGTLFPTLGLFNVYAFIFSFVADHWQYLASAGALAAAAAAVSTGIAASPERLRPAARGAAAALVIVLGILAWRQAQMYRDIETFYRVTLERNPSSWMGHVNLGLIELDRGELSSAEEHFREAARLKPDNAQAHNDVGLACFRSGRLDEAIAEYQTAVRLVPVFAEARNNLGLALSRRGRLDEAQAQLREAVRLKPGYSEAHNNLGIVLAQASRVDAALGEFRRAVELRPDYVNAWVNLGNAWLMAGQPGRAAESFRRALEFEPDSAAAQSGLAYALEQSGRVPGGPAPR